MIIMMLQNLGFLLIINVIYFNLINLKTLIFSSKKKALGLNDYLTFVKTPMDLGTVKRNLKNNKY